MSTHGVAFGLEDTALMRASSVKLDVPLMPSCKKI